MQNNVASFLCGPVVQLAEPFAHYDPWVITLLPFMALLVSIFTLIRLI